MTDGEIIRKLKISSKDRVLDIGGSMRQHDLIKVDTLVDLICPEEAPYGASKLKAKNFVKCDITREKLPFKDKTFDVCLCTHTLEDLPNPFFLIEEISRVARRGIIITPSMGKDMVFGHLDFTNWLTGARRQPGEAHHKWFFIKNKKGIMLIPKIYPILYTGSFQLTDWSGESEMIYVWKNNINYEILQSLSMHNVIDFYTKFLNDNKKHIKKGGVLIYLDNPYDLIKALAKKLFRIGAGYKYRSWYRR